MSVVGFGKTPPSKGGYKYGKGPNKPPKKGAQWEPWRGATPLAKTGLVQTAGGVIQQHKASSLELRVYQALLRLGYDDNNIWFQTPILGGRNPGGLVLDFVIWGGGMPTIIEVLGDYFHARGEKQQQDTKEKEAKIKSGWSGPMKYLPLATGDILDDEAAYTRLLHDVGEDLMLLSQMLTEAVARGNAAQLSELGRQLDSLAKVVENLRYGVTEFDHLNIGPGVTEATSGTIAFPSSGLAGRTSNVLSTYETGNWTPVLAFGGSSAGITYGTQTGTYTRNGNVVTLEADIALTSKGAATGVATITGLPFACALYPVGGFDAVLNFASLSTTVFIVGSSAALYPVVQAATGRTILTDANFTNTSTFRLSLTYRT